MIPLQSFIHRKIVVLPARVPLSEAARVMSENQIGCVLVASDSGEALGIVTDRDFISRPLDAQQQNMDLPVERVVSRHLISAHETAGLEDIIRLMETHGIRRIPIVNRKKFVGIVTLDDLVAGQLVDLPRLSRIIRRQISRRFASVNRPHASSVRAEVRSDARKIQTLQRFYAHIADSTGLTKDLVPPITHFILASLLMRVSWTGSVHFLAQIPDALREALLELPPGPTKLISTETILAELVSQFEFSEGYARTVLHRFIRGLTSWMGRGQMDHLRAQLPKDFYEYFKPMAHSHRGEKARPSELELTSPEFSTGSEIPRKYTGEGLELSPPLEWSHVPQNTREFAIICEDVDAPTQNPWIHWVAYGIPADMTQLSEGFLPSSIRQGKNSGGEVGYQGPLPPKKDDWHRYYFHLYALDREVVLPPGATADELREQMRGHICGEAILMSRYRSRSYRGQTAAA